jgi:hypothetical protein
VTEALEEGGVEGDVGDGRAQQHATFLLRVGAEVERARAHRRPWARAHATVSARPRSSGHGGA